MEITTKRMLKTMFLVFANFCLSAIALAQTMPDLGNDITICQGSTGTKTISIENKSEITQGISPYKYSWLLLNGGEYTVLKTGYIENLMDMEDYTIDISLVKTTSTLRLEIIGDLDNNSEYSVYLFDDKNINVQNPTVGLSESITCERSSVIINADACNIDNSPFTYSYVYNDPLESNFNATIPNTTEWITNNSAVFTIPDFSDDVENKEINVRVRIKDANNDIQESENLKISINNMGQPALPVFKYLCNERVKLELQLDGMDESELSYVWYRYYDLGDSMVLIQDSVGSSLYVTEAGYYQAIVIKTSAVDGTNCSRASGRVKVINVGNVDANIMADHFELHNMNDSVLLFFTFPFDSFTLDFIHVQWFKNNTAIEGATSLSYYAKEEGVYKAVLYEICNKETTSNEVILIQNITGTKELNKNNLFNIYPNPSKNIVTIECINQKYLNEDVNIKILDAYGKLLMERNGKLLDKQIIDLKEKSEGVYFINITLLTNAKTNSIFKVFKTNN
ncbi:MAG: T9SS type A sorting domain-containing protein [Bacteroidota bacterium]